MGYKYGSLEWTIMNHIKINESRKEKVIDILHNNGINNFSDLRNKLIPRKGLTRNEIKQIDTIKYNVIWLNTYQQKSARVLYDAIGQYATKHEQSRIFNILKERKIFSERLLASMSDEDIRSIYGIGPKSMIILKKVKADFLARCLRYESGRRTIPGASQPAAMPLAAF